MDAIKSEFIERRLPLVIIIILSMLFTVGLVIARVFITEKVTFLFLIWNLILAFIPFFISTLLYLIRFKLKSDIILFAGVFLWLLFFPNAPYILTDLFHLKQRVGIPIWFDLMVILSAAWNGLILGLLSLHDIHFIIAKRFTKFLGWCTVVTSLILSGFGIYVGRYLRWNSWDLVTHPKALLNDLFERVVNPLAYPKTLGVTVLYMTFLFIAYLLFRQLSTSLSQRQPIS